MTCNSRKNIFFLGGGGGMEVCFEEQIITSKWSINKIVKGSPLSDLNVFSETFSPNVLIQVF
jgi:hypothetical protein